MTATNNTEICSPFQSTQFMEDFFGGGVELDVIVAQSYTICLTFVEFCLLVHLDLKLQAVAAL